MADQPTNAKDTPPRKNLEPNPEAVERGRKAMDEDIKRLGKDIDKLGAELGLPPTKPTPPTPTPPMTFTGVVTGAATGIVAGVKGAFTETPSEKAQDAKIKAQGDKDWAALKADPVQYVKSGIRDFGHWVAPVLIDASKPQAVEDPHEFKTPPTTPPQPKGPETKAPGK